MPPTMWVVIGLLFIGLGNWMIIQGNIFRSQKSTTSILDQTKKSENAITEHLNQKVDEIRKIAREQSKNGTVVINNNGTIGAIYSRVKTEIVSLPLNREAKIILSLSEALWEISDSHNVSAITDNGIGDISVVFSKDFLNKNYYVNVTGDRTIQYGIIEKEKSYIRIRFEETNLKVLQVECRGS